MQVKEIMTPNPDMIPADASLMDVAEKMKDLNVGVMPVEEDNAIVGMVTDRDIVVRGIAENKDPSKTRVVDVMSRDIITCPEDTDVRDAAQTMEKNKVRRLIITDSSGRLAGIVSLGDIATKSASNVETGGQVLSGVSRPSHPSH